MEQQVLQIADVLNRTVSADVTDVKRAEGELSEYARTPGYAAVLLYLLRDQSAQEATRLAAAVALKNFIRNNWNPDSGLAVAPLADDERAQLRNDILQAMLDLGDKYRRQLSQSVCIIGQQDFPKNWPNLMNVLAAQLESTDFDHIYAALSTIEELMRRYRFEMKSVELFDEIRIVLQSAAPQITNLYTKMLKFLPESGDGGPTLADDDLQKWLEIMLMEVKCFYSLNWQDFPAFFEDNIAVWMNGFIRLLNMQLPDESVDDNDPTTFDDIRRTICNIFRLFAQRYEDDFKDYIASAIQVVWKLLVATDHRLRFDALVNSALGFLSAVAEKERNKELFDTPGVLETICTDVIIKNLTLRREDIEQFTDEPFEYLKRDIEGLDVETRRRGAAEFVRSLAKNFEARVFEILSKEIVEYLSAYSSDPANQWVKKDAVYFLVSALATKAITARHGATATSQLINISDFYVQHVRNDLFNNDFNTFPPILVADALNFIVLFRNQLQADAILEVFNGAQAPALRILSSTYRILHHYLGYAFDKLFMTKRDNVPLFAADRLPVQAYIGGFCQALTGEGSQKSHYLIKALLRFLSIMDQKAVESSNLYINYLVQLVDAVVKVSLNPMFTHMVFESLCVVIKKAFPYIQESINNQVMPIIEAIIERDLADFVPYALQIVALLLYQVRGEARLGRPVANAERYESFFPHLLTGKFWHRPVNAPALLSIFEAFVRTSPELVLQSTNISAVMGLYQKLIAERTWEEHGFRLATILIPHFDKNDVLTSRNILLPMLNRIQNSKTPRFGRSFVMFLCRFATLRGGLALAEALNRIQDGMYAMVVEKIVIAELISPVARNAKDKKKLVTGLAHMISETANLLGPDIYQRLGEVATSIEQQTAIRGPGEDEEAGNEAEYTDPFCKLSNLQAEEEAESPQ